MSVYAFGSNCVDGIKCPAMQTNRDPTEDGDLLQVTERYDDAVATVEGKGEGVVDEEVAKQEWLSAMRMFPQDTNAYKAARKVAFDHGWLP